MDVEDLIKKYNLRVAKPYLEESQSAFKEGRSKFNEMLERLRNDEAQGVIVWHPNRIARNYADGGKFVQAMSDGHIKIVFTWAGGTFEDNPRDKEYLMTEFTRATRDSDDKGVAVKRGNRTRFFEKKRWIGPAKIGYLNIYNDKTKEKEIAIDPDRFPLVVKAIKLIINGTHTPMQALNILNNEWGFRTKKTKRQGGKPLAKSGWYKLLADPFIYGWMVRKEGETDGSHKPMIREEEFEKLQIILGRKGKPRTSKHQFAYKEALKCGECEGSITAEEKYQIICSKCKTKFHKGKTTNECLNCHTLIEEMINPKILHYVFYHCTKRVNKNCTQGSITLKNLEKKIDETLSKFDISDYFRDWAIEHLNELNNKEEVDQTTIKDNLVTQLNTNHKAIQNLLREKISPENSDFKAEMQDYYETEKKRLFKEKKDIQKAIAKLAKRQEQWYEQSKETFDFACSAKYQFATGDAKIKTYVLSKLGSNLVIKDRKLHISGDKAYFLIEKGKKEIASIVESLEPAKQAEIASNLLSYEPIRSAWLPS